MYLRPKYFDRDNGLPSMCSPAGRKNEPSRALTHSLFLSVFAMCVCACTLSLPIRSLSVLDRLNEETHNKPEGKALFRMPTG